MVARLRRWLDEPVTAARAAKLRPLMGTSRGRSSWLLVYPIISLPPLIALAIEGYWYAALAAGAMFAPALYLIALEYKVYPRPGACPPEGAADWYPNPDAPDRSLRYWDGSAWTEHKADLIR